MKARDIMRREPVVVTPTDSICRAAEFMHYERDACLPVVRDRSNPVLVGMITARDIVVRCIARRHGLLCLTRDHMTPLPLHTVLPDDSIADVMHKMATAEVRRIPVVTAEGLLLGMVTENDVADTPWAQPRAPRRDVATRAPAIMTADASGAKALEIVTR